MAIERHVIYLTCIFGVFFLHLLLLLTGKGEGVRVLTWSSGRAQIDGVGPAGDESEMRYQTVDSILGAALDKPFPWTSLLLTEFLLSPKLQLAGCYQSSTYLVYDARKLHSWNFRHTASFDVKLRRYAEKYQTEKCSS